MPIAYACGLTVTANIVLRKERLLPVAGEVLVAQGQQVEAETPVARAMRPGNLTSIKVSERLGVNPGDVPGTMRKAPGEAVTAGEVIAETRSFFGLFHNACASPVAGVIEHVSPLSGFVAIREAPVPLEVLAHIGGRVERVIEGQGVVVETQAALVQGIFGVGGERRGVVRMAARGPEAPLDLSLVGEQARGAVLVGGASADGESLAAAGRAGAAGVVVGGIADTDLRAFVGYDIGVAITGQEQVPFTLIITEGFGSVAMAAATFELLASLAGRQASIDGETQIRAGVIRPEIIVARGGIVPEQGPSSVGRIQSALGPSPPAQLAVGAQVRLIREPYFGRLGKVTALPAQPQPVETEAKVRVVEVELEDGRRALVPRANVEMVHG
ncbi:MAG TPA: hypothetical protein VM221_05825 [Armatimonadota bacterium]|nr:hypothetical protein [Armatimonadota bacterium]